MEPLFQGMREQCPDLAWKIDALNDSISGHDNQYYRVFESAQETAQPETPALAPGMMATRYAPPRAANITSDVFVPVLQSVIAGLFIIAAVFTIVAFVPWFSRLQQDAWIIAVVIGAIALAAIYIVLMRRHSDATTLVQIIEEVTRLDIDRDGAIGKPEPPVERIVEPLVIRARPEARKYHIPSFGDVPYEALHTFLDYADEDGFTLESARAAGLDPKQWNAVITYTAKLNLTTDKSQGRDAELLPGVDHDMMMKRVFSGA